MKLSIAKAKDVDRCAWLTKCFSEYMAPGQFVYDRSHLVDIKWRSDGMYAVMLFEVGPGDLIVADVAGAYSGAYEVCNDSETCYSEAMWKSVKVDRWCDGFEWDDSLT